jgi:twitching motility protein PilT
MKLAALIAAARSAQASDLHLEPGLPAALRVRGQLNSLGDPIPGAELLAMARELVGEERWPEFVERRSCDLSRTLAGARLRVNVLRTSRGVGLAIRFLAGFAASVAKLNLHPDLLRLAEPRNGLVIVSGATGSGKSTTLAALIQEINTRDRRHIVTLEAPIEYSFVPRQAFIRQREVGRDVPSFQQGLYDALREDPDVLVVGELRDPETMRLTLNAAETGHLVLTTLHSATCAEALQRIVSAFPAEIQSGICAQLADCLIAVVCQRMRFIDAHGVRAPECEVLFCTPAVKAIVRQGHFFKLQTALETGGNDGLFTFARYREWMEKRIEWQTPSPETRSDEPASTERHRRLPRTELTGRTPAARPPAEGTLEIGPGDEDLARILFELEGK